MDICGKRMYDLLQKLNFERLSTFEGEKKAAEILTEEIRKIGLEPTIETFKAPRYTIKTAKLEVTEPFYKEYEVSGYGFSGNDAADGIEAEFVYLEELEPMDLQDVKGKIVFIANGLRPKDFKTLLDAGVRGAISSSGMFYDTEETADLDQRMLRPMHIEHGKLPCVCMRMKDALEMIASKPQKVKLTLSQEEGEADSQNVMTEISGTEYPDEVIVYTAHYDSVIFSHGMYDNATGTATILELLRYYKANPPKRTLRFIWCGSEERGLLGSKFYVREHEEDLKKIRLCINVDMIGPLLGRDIALVTGEEALCNYITYLYKELGHPMNVLQEICSSDSIPFADKGIPCVNFLRKGAKNTYQIHCRHDVIDILSAEAMERTVRFIAAFSDRVIGAKFFPIEKTMPEIMVDKVNKYLRKTTN
ncbi:MAG: M28 family peptidase [Clostridia bacterium]|nr:M28 family peptidase [Clostridia bacterium]